MSAPTTYDRIAAFYDADMGRNMAHDDVAFYVRQCAASGGPALELGCGTGRILLELLAAGIEAFGADASMPMLDALRRKAGARKLGMPATCQADVRALPFRRTFRSVLCPYSLITYLVTDEDVARMLAGVADALTADGALIVDAFVPRAVASPDGTFTLDYRRAYAGGVLQRWKRITPLSPVINRIERRYERLDAAGALLERIDAVEDIRPFTPEALHAALDRHGYAVECTWWDYGATESTTAQFCTVRARPRQAVPPTVRLSSFSVG